MSVPRLPPTAGNQGGRHINRTRALEQRVKYDHAPWDIVIGRVDITIGQSASPNAATFAPVRFLQEPFATFSFQLRPGDGPLLAATTFWASVNSWTMVGNYYTGMVIDIWAANIPSGDHLYLDWKAEGYRA